MNNEWKPTIIVRIRRNESVDEEWQPAVIATKEHVLKSHAIDPGFVTRFAGKTVRVRRNEYANESLRAMRHLWLSCSGEGVEVHPEDAQRLWPDIEQRVTLCTCELLMD